MGTTPPERSSTGRTGLGFLAGAVLGLVLLVPGWPLSIDLLPSGTFGLVVLLAAAGLIAFALGLWLVVVVFVLR